MNLKINENFFTNESKIYDEEFIKKSNSMETINI